MTAPSQLTYTGVLLAVFAQQLCLPIPSVIFLIAAGALSAEGGMHTGIVISVGVLACLAADGLWFWFGRQWGSQIVRRLCRFSDDPRRCSENAHEKFSRYGLPILCVAKFLPGVDIVMPPLVGAEGVSPAGFLAFDAVGSFLWSAFYVALGYFFSNEVDIAIRWVKHLGTALGIAIGVPIALYLAWRRLVLLQVIRRLRLRRISAPMLERKLKSNSKVAVIDLLNFEEETEIESLEAIPGAMRIDPSRLRKSPHITVPDDIEIILYSSSGGDIVSARVAVALNRIGVDKVWVLEGGLKAWREQGFSLSKCLEVPEVVAARLGIKLPDPSLA
jgi:membrane protein DedA with SNARE-associated domain/rhodanese-related sulfurtransferase